MKAIMKSAITPIVIVIFLAFSGCATVDYFPGGKTDTELAYDRASRSYRQRQYNNAADQFENVISEYPESPLVEVSMYYLANCYARQGESQEARLVYKKLIDKYNSGIWVDSAKQEIKELR